MFSEHSFSRSSKREKANIARTLDRGRASLPGFVDPKVSPTGGDQLTPRGSTQRWWSSPLWMAPGTDEDNVGALAEAVWSKRDYGRQAWWRSTLLALKDSAPTSVMLSQGDANENGTRMRQTRGVECQTSLNMAYPDGLISC